MAERPILLFPTPEPASRDSGQGYGSRPTIPSHHRLIERQRPKFLALIKGFRDGRYDITTTATGIEPEKALVIIIKGSISSFLNLCEKTDGIEFLSDVDLEEVEEDPDYPDAKKGKLILSMTNSRGLYQMFSLWNQFRKDEDFEFPYGFTQWKQIFEQLEEIRFWGIEDRLEETAALDNWKFEIDHHGKDYVQTEIEMFYRSNSEKRSAIDEEISVLIDEIGGELLKKLIINEISYHGYLVSIPKRVVELIARGDDVKLVHCNYIMYFRPVGQTVPLQEPSDLVLDEEDNEEQEVEKLKPRLAILDGLPIQNHFKIKDHISVVDPDGFEDNYPAEHRKHGTAMASLVINGDLEDEEENFLPKSSIYLRPLLKYDPFGNSESVPEGQLLIDLVYRAVVDIKDEQANEETKQSSIQAINICVGDPLRLFHNELSSLARLLDWLSWKYNVLFIVSAGNHSDGIKLNRTQYDDISQSDLSGDGIRELLFTEIHKNQRFKRLLSPAESINSLTVGAINNDKTDVPDQLVDLIGSSTLPASFNPVSYGFRKAVKPELFNSGGKSVFRLLPHNQHQYNARLHNTSRKPGHKVASPSNQGNSKGVSYTRGTSNATALTSRNSLKIIEMLDEINAGDNIYIAEHYYPVVIKALLIHSCSWGDGAPHLEKLLKNSDNSSYFKKIIQKYLGYGICEIDRSLECIENRATIIGIGTLNKDEGQRYTVPIPPCFSDTRVDRRVILTLSWLSPLNIDHSFYRRAHLTMDIETNEFMVDSIKEAHHDSIVKGTVEHRVLKSNRKVAIGDDDNMYVKVTCREDAGYLNDPIRYSLAVTIENLSTEEVQLPVYEQVKDRITIRVRPQA